METKFQTSFIPKKPLTAQEVSHAHASTSIIMIIGVVVFLASIGAVGLTFIAKNVLLKSQDKLSKNLKEIQTKFNTPLIEDLKKADLKIDLAKQLLQNHIAVSQALEIVGGLTAQRVRFSAFEFSSVMEPPNKSPVYKIKMKGITDTYNSVGFQSDVFGESKKFGTYKVLSNPVLSDLTADTTGAINFNFGADIVLADISYEKALLAALKAEGN